MKHKGRGIVRLHDKTSHGGEVITASGPTIMGLPATRDGDMTHCPKCKGDFAIVTDGLGATHYGRKMAYLDDKTACGATLISSL